MKVNPNHYVEVGTLCYVSPSHQHGRDSSCASTEFKHVSELAVVVLMMSGQEHLDAVELLLVERTKIRDSGTEKLVTWIEVSFNICENNI